MNTQAFTWLLRREYWENRGGFWLAPLITSGIMFGLIVLSLITLEVFKSGVSANISIGGGSVTGLIEALQQENPEALPAVLNGFLAGFSQLLQIVLFFVLFFYLLGALYDERKDRSILFWKSLPISDTSTVMSKVASALLVAPVLVFVITILSHVAFLAMLSLYAMVYGVSPLAYIWGPASPLALWLDQLITIPVQMLWALPAVGWLLLCSCWARSKPFLWAVLIPVALGTFNAFFSLWGMVHVPIGWYWSQIAGRALLSLSPLSWLSQMNIAERLQQLEGQANITTFADITDHAQILGSLDTWIGAAVGCVLIGGAIYLRRWRDES